MKIAPMIIYSIPPILLLRQATHKDIARMKEGIMLMRKFEIRKASEISALKVFSENRNIIAI